MTTPAPIPTLPVPSVAHPLAADPAVRLHQRAVDGAESVPTVERSAPLAPLLRTSWLRRVVIWANAAAIPGAFAGDLIGASLTLISIVALVVWSGVISTNVRRARVATRHGGGPHPAAVVLSWCIAPVVGVVALVAIVAVGDWAAAGTFEEEGTRSMVQVATALVAGLAVLIAAYWPYRVLAKCAKWVSADGGRFRMWFAAPIIAALVAVVVQIMSGLVVLSNSGDGSSSSATIAAVALWVVSFTLPWLAWLIFGNRAMRSLESGVDHAHGRAARHALDPAQVDPLLAGPLAAASVGVQAVSAQSA